MPVCKDIHLTQPIHCETLAKISPIMPLYLSFGVHVAWDEQEDQASKSDWDCCDIIGGGWLNGKNRLLEGLWGNMEPRESELLAYYDGSWEKEDSCCGFVVLFKDGRVINIVFTGFSTASGGSMDADGFAILHAMRMAKAMGSTRIPLVHPQEGSILVRHLGGNTCDLKKEYAEEGLRKLGLEIFLILRGLQRVEY
ncbi:hypothetical protein QQ045_024984 [Rhodiola kirilowii]